jgi:protein-disulfide isomerase
MTRFLLAAAFFLTCATPALAQDAKLAERSASARLKGNGAAQVVVYEIADFQCPFCARFAQEVYPRIDSAFVRTGKVQWIFVNLPLPNHANSFAAAEAAMCAGGAGDKFWPMHDLLFGRQRSWSMLPQPAATFSAYAKEAGADMAAYQKCTDSDLTAALIVRDVMLASSVKVTGTPAFSINGAESFSGLRSFEEWSAILQDAIQKGAAK